jgi:hypothetical protein
MTLLKYTDITWLLILSAFVSAEAQVRQQKVNSTISKVSVYTKGAQVTRKAQASIN